MEQLLSTWAERLGAQVSLSYDDEFPGLPLFIKAEDTGLQSSMEFSIDWLRRQQAQLNDILDTAGAIVLRGFAFENTRDFNNFIDLYPGTSFGYEGGGTPRGVVEGKALESTKVLPQFVIQLHQEMAYLPRYPKHIAFFCETPADSGGSTTICDMRSFTERVSETLFAAVKGKGVRYVYNFRAPGSETGFAPMDVYHRTWHAAFSTQDKTEAEESIKEMGLGYEWLPDGSVCTSFESPGVLAHPTTGEELWFNSIVPLTVSERTFDSQTLAAVDQAYAKSGMQRPVTVSHNDGSPLDADAVDELFDIMESITVAFPWHAGDIMILDNIRIAHGRSPFEGERNVQVAFLD